MITPPNADPRWPDLRDHFIAQLESMRAAILCTEPGITPGRDTIAPSRLILAFEDNTCIRFEGETGDLLAEGLKPAYCGVLEARTWPPHERERIPIVARACGDGLEQAQIQEHRYVKRRVRTEIGQALNALQCRSMAQIRLPEGPAASAAGCAA